MKPSVWRDREPTNEYRLTVIDPGGTIGWAHFVIDVRAFSRPEHRILHWIKDWDHGEFVGAERDTVQRVVSMLNLTIDPAFGGVSYLMSEVVCEDFELKQLVGGKNLLSPVRINAIIEWECQKRAIRFNTQMRHMRTSVTRERLEMFGFGRGFKKDEFAAMQHAIVYMRQMKAKSKRHPWKLSERDVLNAYWDCDCADGKPCDMIHPR